MTTNELGKPSADDGYMGVNVRLTIEQHHALKMISTITGRTLAEVIGVLAIDEAERQDIDLTKGTP